MQTAAAVATARPGPGQARALAGAPRRQPARDDIKAWQHDDRHTTLWVIDVAVVPADGLLDTVRRTGWLV
jgi:hypothetical protein